MKIVPRFVSTFLSALCGDLALTVFQVHITVCIVAVRTFRRIFSLRSLWYPVYFFCLAGFRLSRNSKFPIFWTISKDARRCRAEGTSRIPRQQTNGSAVRKLSQTSQGGDFFSTFCLRDRINREVQQKTDNKTAKVCPGCAATACPRSRDRRDPRARPDFGSQTPGSMATDVDGRRHFGLAPRFLRKV